MLIDLKVDTNWVWDLFKKLPYAGKLALYNRIIEDSDIAARLNADAAFDRNHPDLLDGE